MTLSDRLQALVTKNQSPKACSLNYYSSFSCFSQRFFLETYCLAVSCLTHPSCLAFDVSRPMPRVSCLASHVSRLMSHAIPPLITTNKQLTTLIVVNGHARNFYGVAAFHAHADGIAIPATPDYVFTKSHDNLDDIRKVLGL